MGGSKASKKIGLVSLVMVGVSSVIGSGWLFSSYYAAKTVGGGAIFAWIFGALIMLVLGLMLAELSSMYPKVGLTSRLLTISHNKHMGYLPAFAIWFGTVSSIPNEAQASVQYISTFKTNWTPYLFAHGSLTFLGIMCCIALIFAYFLLNYWGIRLLARVNNSITVYKIIVPIFTGVCIILAAYHGGNFTAYQHTLLPYGFGSIFSAIITCGILYTFNGFQYVANFAAEVRHPERNIPLALILTLLFCLGVYLLLQTAFIGSLTPAEVAAGWHNLNFTSPLAQITIALGLNIISLLLYVDSCISPSGVGLVYTSSSARMLSAMAEDGQLPAFLKDKGNLLFRPAAFFNLGLCIFLLIFARNWQSLMIIVSLFYIISFMSYPLALARLRVKSPQHERPFKVPAAGILCPLIFIVLSLLFIEAGARQILLVTAVNVCFYMAYLVTTEKFKWVAVFSSFKEGSAILLYTVCLTILCWLVTPSHSVIPKHIDELYLITALSSLLFYYMLTFYEQKDENAILAVRGEV